MLCKCLKCNSSARINCPYPDLLPEVSGCSLWVLCTYGKLLFHVIAATVLWILTQSELYINQLAPRTTHIIKQIFSQCAVKWLDLFWKFALIYLQVFSHLNVHELLYGKHYIMFVNDLLWSYFIAPTYNAEKHQHSSLNWDEWFWDGLNELFGVSVQ